MKTKTYPHFSQKEIACRCGCGADNVSDRFMRKLEVARIASGIPYVTSCICRCPVHNKAVGGSDTSSHMSTKEVECKATDITYNSSVQRLLIVEGLLKAGIRRIGIAKTFIHADDDEHKSPCIWLYD